MEFQGHQMPSSVEVHESEQTVSRCKRKKKRVSGGRLYYTNRKRRSQNRMRNKVASRKIGDDEPVVRTLFEGEEFRLENGIEVTLATPIRRTSMEHQISSVAEEVCITMLFCFAL